MQRVGVIGAGPMGLTLACRLLRHGMDVTVYEADDRVGGMSASFDFDGLDLERYYHFICGPDLYLFDLLDELGLQDALKWADTRMGYYYQGEMYPWGDPVSLLRWPHLGLVSKVRYALHVLRAKSASDWKALDKVEASDWIRRWMGAEAYELLWKGLFEKKFYELSRPLSAAWIGTRVKRVALSRRNAFKESMGYLAGGSRTLLDALTDTIRSLGGRVQLDCPVKKVLCEDGRVSGVSLDSGKDVLDSVITTMPLQYLPEMVDNLPHGYREQVLSVRNIGVVCVLFKLAEPYTGNFWLNINDENIDVPGIIELSNLRPMDAGVVYMPWYMPQTNERWAWSEDKFVEVSRGYLKLMRPDFSDESILASRAFRYEYAQPICPPGFFDRLPPYETGVSGLYAADTTHSYPEDRSINESIRIAEELADRVLEQR